TNRLNLMFVDSKGILWIGAEDGGLIRYKDGIFTSYMTENGFPDDRILAIQEDAEGNLWLTTRRGIIKWKDDRLVSLASKETASPEIQALYQWATAISIKSCGLWYVDKAGLHRFDRGRWVTYTRNDGLSSYDIYSIYEDPDGALWLATTNGKL